MTNAEIVRNPHLPSGWRPDAPISLSRLLGYGKAWRSSALREFDSSLLAFVVAVVSRPPLVELGSTATLRPGNRSNVRDRLYHFQLHTKLTLPSLQDFGDLLFA